MNASTTETQAAPLSIDSAVLSVRISDRDRLIGKLEALLLMVTFALNENNQILIDAINAALQDIRDVYGDE